MTIAQSFDTPVLNTENVVLTCPICHKDFYLLIEDFEANESAFCPHCQMWLILTNETYLRKERDKADRLKFLNENRRRKTKKYQRQAAQKQYQSNLFGDNNEE